MSVVRTTKTSTRPRGRGRGRGNQNRHNPNTSHSNVLAEDSSEKSSYERVNKRPSRFSHNQGNRQFNQARGAFKNNRNLGHNSANSRPPRPVNFSDDNSSSPTTDQSRIPKHAQNPIFIGQLMHRFNHMLPHSTLLEGEMCNSQQPKIIPNPFSVSNVQTLDSMKNSPNTTAVSNLSSDSAENNGFWNQSGYSGKKNTSNDKQTFKNGNNRNLRTSNSNCTARNKYQENFRKEELQKPVRNESSNPHRPNTESPNPPRPNTERSNHHRPNTKSSNPYRPNVSRSRSYNQYHGYNLPSNSHEEEPPVPLNFVNNNTTERPVDIEKRLKILKDFGFDPKPAKQIIVDAVEEKTQDERPQSSYHGTSNPLDGNVRYNASFNNEPPQNPIKLNSFGNGKIKDENKTPQISLGDTLLAQLEAFATKTQSSSSGNCLDYNKCASGQNYNSQKFVHRNSSQKNGGENIKMKSENNSPQNCSAGIVFPAQIVEFTSASNNVCDLKSLLDRTNAGKQSNSQDNKGSNKNRQCSYKPQSFNPFLDAQRNEELQSQNEGRNSAQRNPSVDFNSELPFPNNRGLTVRDVAGGISFNVQRSARDGQQRVASRQEALDRIQNEYEVQRAEHEQKQKQRETKKREQKLAKYKYVDQGHRLNEGYLDEAAGFAPGFNPFETEEEVRQRQQEKMRQDALIYQERKREENESRQKREDETVKKWVESCKNYNTGYRLGRADNQAPGFNPFETEEEVRQRQQEKMRQDALIYQERKREENESRHKREDETVKKWVESCKNYNTGYRLGRADNQGSTNQPSSVMNRQKVNDCQESTTSEEVKRSSISPDLMLEGETEEEALNRQQEQLIVEMLIRQQQELAALQSGLRDGAKAIKSNKENQSRHSSTNRAVHQVLSNSRQVLPQTSNQGAPKDIFLSSHNGQPLSGVKPKCSGATFAVKAEEKTDNNGVKHEKCAFSVLTELGLVRKKVVKRRSMSPQLENVVFDSAQSLVPQGPVHTSQVQKQTDVTPEKPASCILKNPTQGAVLVLRPTQEALNQTLAMKLEVQDEMDKHGFSVHYTPQTEPTPVYINNRFERKLEPNVSRPSVKSTGAIPKKMVSTANNDSAPKKETEKPGEAAIDYQAELRAARLRMQKQYEEAIQKRQNQ